jgi:hypothetical protein
MSTNKLDRPPLIHFEYCLGRHEDKVDGNKVPDGSITSVSVNNLWLYFYHENLVAIRHQREKWSYYIDLKDCKDVPPEFIPPSIERLDNVHIEIISRDFGGDEDREVVVVPLLEMGPLAIKLLGDEISNKVIAEMGLST